jgi:hypothetical protein
MKPSLIERFSEITLAIAETGKWRIAWHSSKGEWQNLRIYGPGKRGERHWSVAWSNSEKRLARCNDATELKERNSKMFHWVVETLSSMEVNP